MNKQGLVCEGCPRGQFTSSFSSTSCESCEEMGTYCEGNSSFPTHCDERRLYCDGENRIERPGIPKNVMAKGKVRGE